MERFCKAIKSTFLPVDRKFAVQALYGFAVGFMLFIPYDISKPIPRILWVILLLGVILLPQLFGILRPDRTNCAYFIGLLLAGGALYIMESVFHVACSSFFDFLIACIGIAVTFVRNLFRAFHSE